MFVAEHIVSFFFLLPFSVPLSLDVQPEMVRKLIRNVINLFLPSPQSPKNSQTFLGTIFSLYKPSSLCRFVLNENPSTIVLNIRIS
jgi:hypothetical protein